MKKLVSISLWALALLVGVCLTACSFHEDVDTCEDVDDGYYIKLFIGQTSSTRAVSDHPYGGEDGDGREYGRCFENDIDNLCIFIYEDNDGKGVNGESTTPIKYKQYFKNLNLSLPEGTYTSNPMKITGYVPSDKDRIIVLANRGNVTNDFNTLADFQGYEHSISKSSQWSDNTDPSLCKNFVMSSAKDDATYGKVNVDSREGTYYDPFSANVLLSRVMARVDIWWKDANKPTAMDGPITFETTDGTGTFKFTHARLVNIPTSNYSTFPLKHVASQSTKISDSNPGTIMGEETVIDGTHIPNNFVHTFVTNEKTASSLTREDWYDNTTLLSVSKAVDASGYPTFFGYKADNTDEPYRVHAYASDSRVFSTNEDIDGDGTLDNSYTVGYATENTMPIAYQKHYYMTGLAIKGTFVPKKVYTWSGSAMVEDASYTEGKDIWHYVDKEDSDPTHSYYFSSEAAVHAYEQSRPAVAHTIDHYINAECYYYIWIRHASPDADHPTGTFPMEYAIVRNNIYRIGIEKVTTIGTATPNDEVTENVYSKIYVRDWRLRQEAEIIL